MSKTQAFELLDQKEQDIYKALTSNLVDEGAGSIKESESTYAGTLPEGITTDTIKTINTHNAAFIKAAHAAVGDMSVKMFKADDKLQNTHTKLDMAGNVMKVNVDRMKTFTNPGTREKVERPAFMSSDISVRGASGSAVKAIKLAISAAME